MQSRHLIFLDELRRHSEREVCLGAAEYAASQRSWIFDPWPIERYPANAPKSADLKIVNGVLATEAALRGFQQRAILRRLPVVYCLGDEDHADADTVGIDEFAVGRMAAEHLWNRGYRSFAFIGSTSFRWSRQREEGFCGWLSEAGATAESHALPESSLPVYWNLNVATRTTGLKDVLGRLPYPCGVFAANDVIACFVLQTARAIKRTVPGDIGVVGVDNDPFPNAAAGLAISSIELPFREVGRIAAKLLGTRWKGEAPGRVIRLSPLGVVVRTSTDAFMTTDQLVKEAQQYVEARRDLRVTVNDVVSAIKSNRVTMSKHFQRELGTSVIDYIRRRRLDYAAEQLRRGTRTVEEIAVDCGYSSASYFSRQLKRLTGQRPGMLRRGARTTQS